MPEDDIEQEITIQDLYPGLTPEEQKKAVERLRKYIELIIRITERVESKDREDKSEK